MFQVIASLCFLSAVLAGRAPRKVVNPKFQEQHYADALVVMEKPDVFYPPEEAQYVQPVEQPQLRNELMSMAMEYEINPLFFTRLGNLQGFQIVLLLDDSGSMGTRTDVSTRWLELQEFSKKIVGIGSVFDHSGIDLFFLNRKGQKNVKNMNQVDHLFRNGPAGYTPLCAKITEIYNEYGGFLTASPENQLLLFIATDGEPYGDRYESKERFISLLVDRNRYVAGDYCRVPVGIAACTDDSCVVDFLNTVDRDVVGLDVVDDYNSERNEILRVQGGNFVFSNGDYIVKSLLGPIDEWFDKLDEKPVSRAEFDLAQGHGVLHHSTSQFGQPGYNQAPPSQQPQHSNFGYNQAPTQQHYNQAPAQQHYNQAPTQQYYNQAPTQQHYNQAPSQYSGFGSPSAPPLPHDYSNQFPYGQSSQKMGGVKKEISKFMRKFQ